MTRTAYLVATGALTLAMPLHQPAGRHLLFLLVSLIAAIPVWSLAPRVPRADRAPFLVLSIGLVLLVGNNTMTWLGGDEVAVLSDLLVAITHLHVLVAAVMLVLRRGRNDVGGLLDASVTAVVVAALTWTLLLQPHLSAAGVSLAQQASLLASVLLLSGVLGALARLLVVADHRPVPLVLLVAAVLVDLLGSVLTITATGSLSVQSAPWREMVFLVCYVLLGLAMLHPQARHLSRPGPAPDDRLAATRVVFLSLAATVVPMVSGIREMAGVHSDAALLTVGNVLIVGLVALRVARLAAQREQAQRALRHQATHDLLTGLPNRAELWTRLSAALDRERAAGQPRVVLLFCDLNGFKAVNDRLGHLAGDRLLTEVAERMRDSLRDGDTVARYGGDEFVLLCEDADQQAAAGRLTAHVRAAVDGTLVGASIGVVLSDGRLSADELIRRADEGMYREKHARRAA
ncbi:GGDEF domain-containing protein [Actinoplanes sp. NPDC024001]|uniref:GGDEF domain-containing protein n=1 Tax=Actinoplanes sp. NPDC024001 TaxID=3154598 RepID=UPI0033CB15C1